MKEMQAHPRSLTHTHSTHAHREVTLGYVVILQIEITNHTEGDRGDITSPEVFP